MAGSCEIATQAPRYTLPNVVIVAIVEMIVARGFPSELRSDAWHHDQSPLYSAPFVLERSRSAGSSYIAQALLLVSSTPDTLAAVGRVAATGTAEQRLDPGSRCFPR